jgi:outer membrane lipoprotein-sorting protein
MPSKEILVILALFSSVFLAGCQEASDNIYGYDFETAKVTYEISGSSTGTSEILIKGEKKYIHNQITQTRPNGEVIDMDAIFIQDGSRLYTLDVQAKTGSQLSTTFYKDLQGLSANERKSRIIADALRDTRDAKEQTANPIMPEKTETIAGQTCDLYKNKNIETCLWQGIPLRTVASLPDYAVQTTTIATNIELNQPISDSEFEVPQGYQITELN